MNAIARVLKTPVGQLLSLGPREKMLPMQIKRPPVRPVELQILQLVPKDPLEVLGENYLRQINRFLNDQLIRFFYIHDLIKDLAVPRVDYLPDVYVELVMEAKGREDRRTTGVNPMATGRWIARNPAKDWGGYTMNPETLGEFPSKLLARHEKLIGLPSKGEEGFGERLICVAEKVVLRNNLTHFPADVRHALHYKLSTSSVPASMKNGKENLFLGTAIMIGSVPHVIAMTFKGNEVEVELVSLDTRLEDTAQFVFIQR